jgi:hypothetical protein
MLVCGAPIRVRTNRPENPRDGALRYCDPEHLQHINAVLKEYRFACPVNHREKSVLMVKNRCAHLLRLPRSLMRSYMTTQRVVEYMEKRRSEGAGNRTMVHQSTRPRAARLVRTARAQDPLKPVTSLKTAGER